MKDDLLQLTAVISNLNNHPEFLHPAHFASPVRLLLHEW